MSTPKSGFQSIGDILLDMGVIDNATLQSALRLQNRRLGEILVEESLADPVAVAQALRKQAESGPGGGSAVVKMSLRTLYEIFAELDQLHEQMLSAKPTAATDHEGEEIVSQNMERFENLRSRLEELLLAPASALFKPAKVAGAEAVRVSGVKAQVIWLGEDLDFDAALLSEFTDMVIHLVRNAIAHGIETPEKRTAVGKPAEGQVIVDVSCDGGEIVLRVADDGRGIDRDRIAEEAASRGLIQKHPSEITDDDIRKFILSPGFSTAKAVNSVAGRGIGLDVIESSAIRLRGSLELEWHKGQGTTFEVRVPLTLCRLSVVSARIGTQWIAVRASEVRNILSKRPEGAIYGFGMLFEGVADPAHGEQKIFIEDSDGRFWAVDEVLAPRPILIHGVAPQIRRTYGISGTFRIPQSLQSGVFVDLRELRSRNQ